MLDSNALNNLLEQLKPGLTDSESALPSSGASDARSVGTGLAFQLVAQSTGLVVQDAGGFLRNLTQISLAAMTVAMEKFVASGGTELNWLVVILVAALTIDAGVQLYSTMSSAAATTLQGFPSS